MTIPGSAIPLLLRSAAPAEYQVSRSVRFNSSDSAYLSRTPASAGNRKTWTWAGWVKLGKLGSTQRVFKAADTYLSYYSTTGTLYTNLRSAATNYFISYANVYRDPSAWYHIVLAVDTTQATAADRQKLYVNGVQVTASGPLGQNYPPQNEDTGVNSTSNQHQIGGDTVDSLYFDGYLADIHFIDGQALDPSSFTEVSATTGQLIPKAYSGSFGTNGFWLKFADNSSASALGTDSSGNSNTWTVNNISVTAGAGNDSLVDTPTSYGTDTGAGGEVRGNYCTWNPLDQNGTLANGNLDFSNAAASNKAARSTFALPTSDKWYAEFTTGTLTNASSGVAFGFANSSADLTSGPSASNRWTIYADATGYIFANGSNLSSSLGTFAAGTVLQIAFDGTTGKAWVGKNNVWYNSSGGTTGDPAAGTNQTFTLSGTQFLYALCFANSGVLNAGARPFAYTAPSGFKALCDTNLPAPVVAKPSEVMDVKLYTGNGSTQTISGLSFSPDLVWIKERNGAADHALYDSVRGVQQQLESNTTTDETTESTGLTAFNSDGFALSSLAQVNTNTDTYVAWCWDESATAGFDIVTYTGNGSARTISHGLGVAPNMIIVKARTTASTDQGWPVYHSANTAAPATDYLLLNSTAATADLDTVWNDTAPTSSVFSVGTNALVNTNNDTYVAYLFSAVVGYSSFGSYVGSTSFPFVYCGFQPRFLLIKPTNLASDWYIYDSARNPYNVSLNRLFPNSSSSEVSVAGNEIDLLSNGFRVLGASNSGTNYSGINFIYMALAENPFQYARAR